jgi:hypothetical protein
MPSKTFQPLLFDSFKYNLPNSTYEDHFHQRKRREFLGLDRKYKNLTQQEKMILLNKRSRPFTVASTTHEPPSFVLNSDNKIIYKKNTHVSLRLVACFCLPRHVPLFKLIYIKFHFILKVNFDPTVSVKEISQRGSSASTITQVVHLETDKPPHPKLLSPPPNSPST